MRSQLLRSSDPRMLLKAHACPICSKSVCDLSSLWEQIDVEVAAMVMPEEYRDKMLLILCNDCDKTSHAAFHVLAMKCRHCKSYNTRQIREVDPNH
mmetsp:Transcript_174/g.328  ORF Transcript_174/g.328 Transcript_174/m.328 type:complete len:96 (+) Transcript_174:811-1098(+)